MPRCTHPRRCRDGNHFTCYDCGKRWNSRKRLWVAALCVLVFWGWLAGWFGRSGWPCQHGPGERNRTRG